MRAAALACLSIVIATNPLSAQQAGPAKERIPLVLTQPVTIDDCLTTLETVLQRALEADLLDDRIDEAESHLDRFEAACHAGQFSDALAQAKAVEKLLATNK